MKDVVKNDYFLLSFYAYDESGSEKVIDLINLTDAHNGSKGAPVTYVDENLIYVKPLSTDDEDNSDSAYYVIESNCELKQQHFYFKLFISEDDYLYD